jgi:hypothetical protein
MDVLIAKNTSAFIGLFLDGARDFPTVSQGTSGQQCILA